MIFLGNINQFGTNKCHYIKKIELDIKPFAFIWDFPKSPINEYSDLCRNQLDCPDLSKLTKATQINKIKYIDEIQVQLA